MALSKKTRSTDDIVKLTEFQHARLRTEMYLGSRSNHTQHVVNWTGNKLSLVEQTWTPAVYCAFREILDNSLDEVVGHGHGSRIDVEYDADTGTFVVTDDGRGIPIEWDASEKMYKATMALTQSRAGRNFGEREQVRGTNGIGASIVAYCSEWFRVDIIRDGQRFQQEFNDGKGMFDHLQIKDPKITRNSGRSGTSIEFRLSRQVFTNFELPVEFVQARIYEIAANHPRVRFTFNGQRVIVKSTLEKTFFDQAEVAHLRVAHDRFTSSYYLVPNFTADGETVHSTVNDIPAFAGGQHIDTFKRLFYSGLIRALERESRRRNLTPNRNDIAEGLLIYNVTTMHAPNFDSQSKTRLINEEVDAYIKQYLDNEDVFKQVIKNNRSWIDEIYRRCEVRTQKRDTADIEKNNRRLMRAKVPKLLDATGRDRSKCVLFLTEGNSAATSLSAVRNPEIHGSLPLRGKIVNANGETVKDLQDNAIVADIVGAIGLNFGKSAERDQLRYGAVYLAADQDPDGANITALLVNFFYLNWPELFDPKLPCFFSVFMTPFIIQQKGNARHYWYADDYQNYNSADWKNCPHPTRAKGLGSLEEQDWVHSLEHPRLIPLLDDGKLAAALDLIFHPKKADLRKEWIALNAVL